jgi:(E)-4-hydroxy-3-methylbut-2-enyl-diphosphate synthase
MLWIDQIPQEVIPQLNLLVDLGISVLTRSTHFTRGLLLKTPSETREGASSPVLICGEGEEEWEKLKHASPPFVLFAPEKNHLHQGRRFFEWLKDNPLPIPVILHFDHDGAWEDCLIHSAAVLGALLADGLGEGISLRAPYPLEARRLLSFNILQAARMRTFKTEYISCPGCGRTLFALQEVTKRIRERTAHLPGVKIAVMGCIVNGPGEMADADFGYVGSKAGKIDLYIGKSCVERDIDFAEADDRLVALIKAQGRWVEPEYSSEERSHLNTSCIK